MLRQQSLKASKLFNHNCVESIRLKTGINRDMEFCTKWVIPIFGIAFLVDASGKYDGFN